MLIWLILRIWNENVYFNHKTEQLKNHKPSPQWIKIVWQPTMTQRNISLLLYVLSPSLLSHNLPFSANFFSPITFLFLLIYSLPLPACLSTSILSHNCPLSPHLLYPQNVSLSPNFSQKSFTLSKFLPKSFLLTLSKSFPPERRKLYMKRIGLLLLLHLLIHTPCLLGLSPSLWHGRG